jgi:hypothetical protein
MGRAFRSRAEHRQEVISAVTALRAHRLEIEIGIRIGLHPLDDSTKDVEWQSPFGDGSIVYSFQEKTDVKLALSLD